LSNVKIYHNPRCSKSRQTLDLIRGNGIEPEVIEYLNTPPTQADIKEVLGFLNLEAKDIVRTKEEVFKALDLDLSNESQVISAISKNPKIMERPIVVNGDKAVIGRPPENVLEIL
jgi:arsenate reductase